MTPTVVIPAYGPPKLTQACVESLLRAGDPYELVLVDNGGARPDLLPLSSSDVYVRNGHNVGFGRACNQGADLAQSDIVVFLNCDTEVRPGWLTALCRPFTDAHVGVVGAQLRYPDGRLQHAGVDLVTVDGVLTAVNVTDPALASVRRSCPAVTGACLAVRRDLFRSVGGFDDGYWNGYEDVDLCLRLGRLGFEVRYEPDAVVMHHESATGPERWAKVRQNIDRLQQQWGWQRV